MYPACWMRSADRWPRWVARIGFQAFRRAGGAMTKRSVPIQVLTIVPSLPLAPCWGTGRTIWPEAVSSRRGGSCGYRRAIALAGLQHGPGNAGVAGGLGDDRDLDRAAREDAALPRCRPPGRGAQLA
jgi:hypothetical protein